MTWTHKFLNCPAPPQEFIELALTENIDLFGPKSNSNYYTPGNDPHAVRQLANGDSKNTVRIPRFDVPLAFRRWIIDNISPDIDEASISISDIGNDGVLGPHTDRRRDYVLIYVIKSGGNNALTRFWREEDQPLYRDRITLVDDYSKLELIDSVNLKEGQWVVLDSRILHSVEHIESRRITFQISFDNNISSLERFE